MNIGEPQRIIENVPQPIQLPAPDPTPEPAAEPAATPTKKQPVPA